MISFLNKIWARLTCKTVFHVAPESAVDSIKAGISPVGNVWSQYGEGFYTFAKRSDAHKWQTLRPELIGISEEHVILEFRIPRRVWKHLLRKKVHKSYNWQVPQSWISGFDILECNWGVTPDTLCLQEAKQYKFNPHTYSLLDTALVW